MNGPALRGRLAGKGENQQMMQTILGIDVRPGEIRLAQISRRLRKTTVTGMARVAVDPGAEPAAIAAAAVTGPHLANIAFREGRKVKLGPDGTAA